MIRFDGVSVTHDGAPQPTLRDVDLTVPEGELALVVGRTGAGKTTLLRCVSALVPWFTGGRLDGRVQVAGVDTRDARPQDLAHLVGVVQQDPLAGFVTDTVEEELAFGMEQLAVPATVMRTRVEEMLDLLGIADLRDRPLAALSGGQQQRVAIGAAMTMQPRVLVLDEPTSALDPTAAEEVLAALTRLVHDLGITTLVAEHRLERVVQYADRVIQVDVDGRVRSDAPVAAMTWADVAPPVVRLGRMRGWDPLPLSVRDARRAAVGDAALTALRGRTPARDQEPPALGPVRLRARDVHVRHGSVHAVRGVDLELRAGEVVALLGRNGSGKSSLLWAMHGAGPGAGTLPRGGLGGLLWRRRHADRASPPRSDTRPSGIGVLEHGDPDLPDPADPARLPAEQVRRLVALVPQTASDLLFLASVRAECAAADRDAGAAEGTCVGILEGLVPGVVPDRHPRDLSEGSRLALVLAIQLTAAPGVVLLDEPTRGLDYDGKADLVRILASLRADGHAVLVATHDVEFVAAVADRAVLLAEGDVVVAGSATEVIGASPTFAPQTAKIVGPAWLTPAAVDAAIGDGSPR